LQETQTSKKSDRIIGLLTSNAHIAEEGNWICLDQEELIEILFSWKPSRGLKDSNCWLMGITLPIIAKPNQKRIFIFKTIFDKLQTITTANS
jgi:hypothetical protein